MNRKFVIRLSIVCVVLFVIFGSIFGFNLVKFYMMRAYLKHFSFPPAAVTAVTVKKQDWQPTFGAVGVVGGTQSVNVASEASGTLEHYYVKSGQIVQKGQPIVSLDYSVQAAQLKQAQAAYSLSQIEFARAQKLYKVGAVPKSNLDQAKSTMEQDQAAVGTLKAEVAEHIIRAPFTGKIGIMPTNVGQYISAGTNLGVMTQVKKLDVTFPITQSELTHVKVGMPFTFTVDSYPNKVFHSKVILIDSEISDKTQGIDIRGKILNTDPNHPLYSGMLIHANMLLPKLKDVIVVPQTAVVESLYGTLVYVVYSRENKEGKKELYADQVYVKVGPAQGNSTVILSGLKQGEKVVIGGQVKLQNGRSVTLEGAK